MKITPEGVQLSIRAAYNGGMDVYEGVQVVAPGVGFDLIEIAPCSECGFAQADKKVDLSFPSYGGPPVAYINLLRDHFDPPIGGVVRLHLNGGQNPFDHDVTGHIGDMAVTHVVNFLLGGDLGVLDEHPSGVGIRGNVGSLHVAGNLYAQFVVVNDGAYSTQDSIIELTVGGDIGVPNPANLTEEYAGRIATANRIRSITARNVYGYIWPGEIDAFSYKGIHRLEVRRVSGVGGDFFGALYANRIVDFSDGEAEIFGQISVQGDYGGTILLTQPLELRLNSTDPPPIVIDGSTVEGIRFHSQIVLPENGLEGQIIVNRANDDGAWGNCRVFVGDVELNAPNYSTLPSAVGGGLVGLAPFDLHGHASDPPQYATLVFSPNHTCLVECESTQGCSISACYVQHYGPVVNFGTTMPVKVETASSMYVPPNNWTDVTTEYKATIVDDGTNSRLKIERVDSGAFPLNKYYRITPKPDILLCRFVEGEPDVSEYTYTFLLIWDCGGMLGLFDLNNDDALNSGDIAEWVAAPVDLNEDDAADSADLNVLIDAVNLYGDN